jgi:hypothetical protein
MPDCGGAFLSCYHELGTRSTTPAKLGRTLTEGLLVYSGSNSKLVNANISPIILRVNIRESMNRRAYPLLKEQRTTAKRSASKEDR